MERGYGSAADSRSEVGMEVAVDPRDEEGWFTDPFGLHEARWLSQGTPTKLVRDSGLESYDEPPDREPDHEPVRIEVPVAPDGGADLIRADDAEAIAQPDLRTIVRREEDAALEGIAHPEVEGS